MNQNHIDLYFENKNHTPYDFPYNTYVCSIPLDFSLVKPHWHNEVEIIVVKKGCGIVSVDLFLYHVKAGDIIFICPGQLHSIRQDGNCSMEYENILFKQNLMKSGGIDHCNDTFIKPFFSGAIRFYPLFDHEMPAYAEMARLIDRIDLLCDQRPFAWQVAVKGYLFQLFYMIISSHPDELSDAEQQKSVEKMKTILQFMEDHFAEHITIREVADYCSYSESYFMKFFKKHLGMGFIQYLNDYRLEQAAERLTETDASITDIAVACGFDNISYFNRSFKKKYDAAPGTYRKAAAAKRST